MKKWFFPFLIVISLFSYAAIANAEQSSVIEDSETDVVEAIPKSLANPRATMETFITAMSSVEQGQSDQIEEAISTLNLSDTANVIRKEKGEELAHALFSVIERSKKVKLDSIPVNPKTGRYVFGRYSQGSVAIVRQADGRWLFGKESVSALPAILQGLIEEPAIDGAKDPKVSVPFYIQVRSQLPDVLKKSFLLEYWQWLGIFITILIGSVADKVLAWFLSRNVGRWKKKHLAFQHMDVNILRPLGLMAMAVIWWFLIGLLGLPDTALIILSVAVKLLVSLSAIWSAFRLVDVVDAILIRKARGTSNRFDDLLVPMITKSLKVFVVIIGVLFSADNFNVDVTSLLAGLGLGGLAFALAARDLLGNFFGSLTVLLDRPFQIGDWVVIADVEGSVEQVGFRSTRIRTFYNSLITLPNSILTNTKIDNMGARRYRRMSTTLDVTYDTPPEKIDAFCEGIRALIHLHPYMRKDYYQVYFNEYKAASLGILVYVFWQTPDWNTELRERHRFLLDILRLAKQLDVEFAFPTQTLYLRQATEDGEVAEHFNPGMSESDAFAIGQKQAKAIVEATTGLDVKPGPVQFPK